MRRSYPSRYSSGVDWIGDLPRHWSLIKFKYLFEIKKDIAGYSGPDVLSITQSGIRVKNIESGEGQVSSDYAKYQHVEVGDFAMNHMDLLTGYVDISRYKGVTSPDYRVFSLIDSGSCKDYFLYILQLGYARRIFYPLGRGAAHIGRWRLPSESFKSFRSPYPPKHEQAKIVEYLDKEVARIDRLSAEKMWFIGLLKEKRQALISHVVTKGLDPDVEMRDSRVEWIGSIPGHWRLKRIKHIAKVNPSTERPPLSADDEVGFIPMTSVDEKKGRIRKVERKKYGEVSSGYTLFRNGDVIFAKITPCMENGNCVMITEMNHGIAFGSTEFIVFRPSGEITQEYLHMVLRNAELRKICKRFMSGTAGQQRISTSFLENFPIAVPPIKEQERIVSSLISRVQKLESLEDQVFISVKLLKEYRTALITAAVTGQIDVRDQ